MTLGQREEARDFISLVKNTIFQVHCAFAKEIEGIILITLRNTKMEYPVLCVGPASSNFERYRVKSLNYICSFKQGHTCRERERERERERDVQGHTYTRTQHNNKVTFFICIC